MWMLLVLGILLTFYPQEVITVWPSTTTPIISSQFDTVNGYGLTLQTGRLSLSCYKATHNSDRPSPDSLIELDGSWVYSREVDLWEINYSVYEKRSFAIGLGLNQVEYQTGWQVYAENNFYDLAVVKLGFRRILIGSPVDAFVASFRVDIGEVIKSFRNQKP